MKIRENDKIFHFLTKAKVFFNQIEILDTFS